MDAIAALLGEADETRRVAEAAKKAIVGELQGQLADQIADAFQHAGRDYGTIHIYKPGFDIEVTRGKTVEWDQQGLADLALAISGGGEDPADYIKTELKVEERKYAAWTPRIRAAFDRYRTTKPTTPTIKLHAV